MTQIKVNFCAEKKAVIADFVVQALTKNMEVGRALPDRVRASGNATPVLVT